MIVDEATAAPVVAPGEALFMDWSAPHGGSRAPGDGWPTFLYAVPLGGGRVLLEETSLARRPGLPTAQLRDRLSARLARHGVDTAPGRRGRARPLPRRHAPATAPPACSGSVRRHR